MTNNLVPIIFFGTFILIIAVGLMFPDLNPFIMKGGGCGCKKKSFLIWGIGILGLVVLLYIFNTKVM